MRRSDHEIVNGRVSFWHNQIGVGARRQPLQGHLDADVCIVGGGLTGLWTAYYLKKQNPSLEVVVLEREFAGFGASGRHGGWLSNELAGSREAMAAKHGRDGVVALLRAMNDSVAEVIRVCQAEGIDADIERDGMVTVARNPAQITRLRREYENEQSWDPSSEHQLLDRDGLSRYVNVTGASDGLFNQNAARVHPAKLVRGVACATEQLGVKIFEETPVTEIRPGAAKTPLGTVRSHAIIDCLEGFNSTLDSDDGTVIPLNSAMIVTDPIPQAAWNAIGWPSSTLVGRYCARIHVRAAHCRRADSVGGQRSSISFRVSYRPPRHHPEAHCAATRGGPAVDVPVSRRCRDRARLVWGARSTPKLDPVHQLRPKYRVGTCWRLCGQRCLHDQLGRSDDGRSRHRVRHRAHALAVGGNGLETVGA